MCSLNQLLTLHITVPTSQQDVSKYSSDKPVREATPLEGIYICYCKPLTVSLIKSLYRVVVLLRTLLLLFYQMNYHQISS